MAVAESVRGQGIGRMLLEYVVAQARTMKAAKLFLETNHRLENAIHLYEAAGFTRIPQDRLQPSPYARSDVSMDMCLR